MTTLTENPRAGEFIVSEAPGTRSREQITIKSGAGILKADTVLAALITAATVASAAKSGGNTGNGTFVLDATTPALVGAKPGVYTLRFTTTTNIRLESKDGTYLADIAITATNGQTATVAEQIKGVMTQGSTTFVVGDGFDITVSSITYQYVQLAPAATDGSQFAAGVLYKGVDATSAAQRAVGIMRAAEVNGNCLTWPSGITTAQTNLASAQLADLGLNIRN